MKALVFSSLFILVSARNIKIDEVEFGFCSDNQPGSIDLIEIQPYPIQFQSGASISVSAILTLDEPNTISTGSRVRLDVKKEGLIPLPIPCLELEGADGPIHLGSCEYDVDYLLTKFSDFLCPDFVPDGQSCTTPLNPGAYGGQPLFEAVIPDIPDIIADLIGSGTYYAGAIITNPDGSEFTCTYLRIQVE